MADRVLFLVLHLTVAVPLAAQVPAVSENPATVQVFEEAVDVRVVNLEAVVTGVNGQRMPGLKSKDFLLIVDGVETPITFFAEVDEKRRSLPGAASAEVGQGESVAPVAETTWQNRNILVFLDETTMVKARRDFVLRSITKQLESLALGDRMAVAAFDGSHLEVLSDWTDDRAHLAATFQAIEAQRETLGIQGEVSRRLLASERLFDAQRTETSAAFVTRPFGDSAPDIAGLLPSDVPASGIVRQFPSAGELPTNLYDPSDRAVEVGEAVAAAMRGMPATSGRKMLLLLTEGFLDPAFGRPVVYEANRLGYSLYPVDVQGLDSFQTRNDAEFQGARQEIQFIRTGRDRERDLTLGSMATSTGGKASFSGNRVTALDDLIEDSAVYYLLGFSPTWRGNDRRHKIELVARRPGFKVRTREGYDDLSRRTWLRLEAGAGLLMGRSRSDPKLVFTIGAPVPGGKEQAASLGIPVDSLAFFPNEKGFRAEAPVAVVALDEQGKKVVLPGTWLRVDVEKLPLAGTYARLDFTIPTKFRTRTIVATIHDALTGETLWAEATPDRPAPPRSE